LLASQIAACQEIGVLSPIYISAGFDEKEAIKHPEWLFRNSDESLTWSKDFMCTGHYHLLCYNTGYLDLLISQIDEVMQVYNPSAIFLDISSERLCYCSSCRQELLRNGKDPRDINNVIALGKAIYQNYAQKVQDVILKYNPKTEIFHNSGHIPRGRDDINKYDTHLELESLPTGGWGYDHFPLSAAYARRMGKEFLGMTGKFHTSWGEFGGYKHANALKYEMALSIACGAKCSIGDQLHPNGKMDMTTYSLIGEAYEEVEKKELWCSDATGVVDIGVISYESYCNSSGQSECNTNIDIGANRVMLEGKYLYNFIDREDDFSSYKLIVFPDGIQFDEDTASKVDEYSRSGGKVLLSGSSGLNMEKNRFAIDIGTTYKGINCYNPTYYVDSSNALPEVSPYIMYGVNHEIEATTSRVVGYRQNPYFNRSVFEFMSHQHTANNDNQIYDAITTNGSISYIGWNIFEDYALKGSLHLKSILINILDNLLGTSKTLETSLVDRGITTLTYQKNKNRYINHLLYAHTSVRGRNIEVIEDIVPLYDVSVLVRNLPIPKRVYLAPQEEDIEFSYADGILRYSVPKVEIHQIVVISN
jgi:hypothetical protein